MSETEGYSWPVAEGAGRGYKTKKRTGYVWVSSVLLAVYLVVPAPGQVDVIN